MRGPLKSILILGLACISPFASGQATKKKQPPDKKAANVPKSDPGLTLDQVRRLLNIHTPDGVVAQEISSRGISDDYVRKDIDQIRRLGAGPEIIAALERLIPVASLNVLTEAGASVKLDGASPFLAGPEGLVVIPGVEPGVHQVLLVRGLRSPPGRVHPNQL